MNLVNKEINDMKRKTIEANKKKDEMLFWQSKKTARVKRASLVTQITPTKVYTSNLPTISETPKNSTRAISARKGSFDDSRMKSFRDKLKATNEDKALATINEERMNTEK